MPYHGYDFKQFDSIRQLHERYPELPLCMTEICHAYEAGTPKTMKLPRTDFDDGDFWGQQIVSDLEAYASAWIYWNLILDEQGGPWLVSPRIETRRCMCSGTGVSSQLHCRPYPSTRAFGGNEGIKAPVLTTTSASTV